tara:strand:- start:653 stop:1249 length:597 start_codon:yes stop_codon:yes gene_type:complete
MIKKAAMFGLDARIALAIFGALSVISGAALYSAIQQAKVIQIITQMREIGKAYEQLILDLGSEVNMDASSPTFAREIEALKTNSISSPFWKGPYISIENVEAVTQRIRTTDGKKIYIVCLQDGPFGGLNTSSGAKTCKVGDQNYNWVLYETFPKDIVDAIDLAVDGEIDHLNGNIRIVEWSSNSYSIYMKLNPTLDFK